VLDEKREKLIAVAGVDVAQSSTDNAKPKFWGSGRQLGLGEGIGSKKLPSPFASPSTFSMATVQ
jgi:hypothetical protein